MLGARSVAVVGASARPGSFGERMVIEAERGSARTYLVNPRYRRIGEDPCAASLKDLDEVPDLVLLGVPDDALIGQLETAAAVGVRSAVLFGSAHGTGMRTAITDIATRAGMAVCGAGCMGFVNNITGVRALGYLEPHPLPGGAVSLVTHSGSAFSTLLRARRGFGFRLAVSSGQELVTDTADYIEYALDDPGTRVIALLLEAPRSAIRLRGALHHAAERDVPVVILTVGGSPRGRAMVAAHSGALAGDAEGWAAFCASTGAIRTTDLSEFTDTLELFACEARAGRLAQPSVRPGGIATVHDSGAERALCADIAHDIGVEFAELSPATLATIGDLLDDGLTPSNPLDVWGTGADTRALFGGCLRAMTDDPAVAATALAIDLVTEYDGDTSYTDAVLDVAGKAPLAVLASVPSAIDPVMAQRLRDHGVAVLEGMRSGLAAMGHLITWPEPTDTGSVVVDRYRRDRWHRRLASKTVRPFDLLVDYGIAVPASIPVRSRTEALAAAAEIGYPVAMKTVGAAHKSEVGGVALGVADAAALTAAYDDMSARLGPDVSVDAMVPAGVEVSVGFVRDAAFGPLVVVAAGGVAVELHGDRAVVCPPVTRAAARLRLGELRMAPLLTGWRGGPPVDVEALVEVIVGFSSMATELGDAVDAVEANPVIVSPTGAIAVDALVVPSSAPG